MPLIQEMSLIALIIHEGGALTRVAPGSFDAHPRQRTRFPKPLYFGTQPL